MKDISEHRRRMAWTAGKKAALSGKPRDTNNRTRGTIYFDDWADGWDEGERERKGIRNIRLISAPPRPR